MKDAETDDPQALLRQQTTLARFGELALRSEDLDEILTEACRLVGQALGTELAKVMELQADRQTLLARAGIGWKPGVIGHATIKATDKTSEGHALKTNGPMISPNVAEEKRFSYPAFLIDNGVQAVANVVIIGGKNRPPFGVLQVDSRSPRNFTDNDTAFLSSYANLIAAAVDRLQIMGDLRDSGTRLRTSVERQQAALETGLIGFFEWDVPAGIMTADKHFAAFYGITPAAAASGVKIDDLFGLIHADDRPTVTAIVEEALAALTDYTKEFRLLHPGGDTRWIHVRGHCTAQAEGRPLRYTGTGVDVTEAKRTEVALREGEERLRQLNEVLEQRVEERTNKLMVAEAALRQSQKMEAVGQLTGGIAHDFNNMLQAIDGSLELMQRRITHGRLEDAAQFAEAARRTVERAASLTHRLLAFARRQVLQPRAVKPAKLVEGMAELIRRTVGPAVEVELRLVDGAWSVLCDPNQLENVLLNLAINARDAMPDGGILTIATTDLGLSAAEVAGHDGAEPGDYVEIAVADTGSGMDEATRERVFEPFFTTKPIGQGTGLGLSQLHGFSRQSGGLVSLESEPGKGTTVRLYLPRHELFVAAEGAGPDPEADELPSRAGRTILLVEDEADVRIVAAGALRELGHRVLEVSDGAAALRVLHGDLGSCIDILVTDVGLPGSLNGRQIADAARERRPGLPVLFITGFAGAALEGRLAPGMEVITKPFGLTILAARVHDLMTERP